MSLEEVAKLRNLGFKSAEMLANVGVTNAEQIRRLGSIGCFLLVKSAIPSISLNLLWAIEGFLLDLDWRDLPDARKNDLRSELAELKE